MASRDVRFLPVDDLPAALLAMGRMPAQYPGQHCALPVQPRVRQVSHDNTSDRFANDASKREAAPQLPRLLIVDDDVAAIQLLQHTLAGMGDICFAKYGEEALNLARSMRPQLILLDAQMPGVDGYAVCAALKADPAFAHVAIVFVTRFSDPISEQRALDLGAADFIAKPYTPAVLQARVRNLLDLARRTEAELKAVREHWRQLGDARVADIVAGALDGIVSFDASGKVVLANAAACRLFGVQPTDVVGRPVAALFGVAPESRLSSEPTRVALVRDSGAGFWAELSVSYVGEGEDLLTTVMMRDTSDRESLETESRARVEAETASRTKTMMLSYIAHEMGNPLNGLLGFAQLMGADASCPLAPKQASRLAHIVTSGHHLEELMRDVLDVGRLETGKLHVRLRPVDAGRCVEDAVAAVSALAEQAGVVLSSSPGAAPVRVAADAGRLHQCLLNLLTNAIKYNRRGGWVRIEAADDSKAVAFSVRDNGLGIDAEQRQHLFEPFNRLGRQRGPAAGAGLGLVITRQLVAAMGGELRVESTPEVGSCFTIVLPSAAELPTHDGAACDV